MHIFLALLWNNFFYSTSSLKKDGRKNQVLNPYDHIIRTSMNTDTNNIYRLWLNNYLTKSGKWYLVLMHYFQYHNDISTVTMDRCFCVFIWRYKSSSIIIAHIKIAIVKLSSNVLTKNTITNVFAQFKMMEIKRHIHRSFSWRRSEITAGVA